MIFQAQKWDPAACSSPAPPCSLSCKWSDVSLQFENAAIREILLFEQEESDFQ